MAGLTRGSVAVVGAAESELGEVAPGTMPVDLVRLRLRGELPSKDQPLWRWE